MPAKNAATVANSGSVPRTMSVAATAAPSGKLPSGVMSGKRSTRDAMYTPHASDAKATPSTNADSQNSHGADLRTLLAGVPALGDPAFTVSPDPFAGMTLDARAIRSFGFVIP